MRDEKSVPPRTQAPRSEQPEFGLVHSDDSDLPLPKKRKGTGPVRKVIGWVFLLGLLVVFAFVLEHRLKHPQIRYVRNAEDVFDESLALAHKGLKTRKSPEAGRTKLSQRKKASDAYNAIELDIESATVAWSDAFAGVPSGLLTNAVARAGIAALADAPNKLNEAGRQIDDIKVKAEIIKDVSREPGSDAQHLSVVYSEAREMVDVMSTGLALRRERLRLELELLNAAVAEDNNAFDVAEDAINGNDARHDQNIADMDRALNKMRDAADAVFR
jgi:hypothetical protein